MYIGKTKPVCYYLSSIGLGESESCPENTGEEDTPLLTQDFLKRQAEFESSLEKTIKDSERRILQWIAFKMGASGMHS
jgi:hypothetical protein